MSKKRVYSVFESQVALDYRTRFSEPFPSYRKFSFFPDIEKKEVTKEQIETATSYLKEKLKERGK